jgi:MFS family permease
MAQCEHAESWMPMRASKEASDSMSTNSSGSAWAPFRFTAFAVLWTATAVSNIGTWMQSAAAGWLMTSLQPDPLTVSLVQVATSLPMFLLALPAGALADILDRRKLLVGAQVAIAIVVVIFALLVWAERVAPLGLLLFTFLAGGAAALTAPAWQAIVPDLVPRSELAPAVALNSIGVNVSRAIGPALAGLMVAALGIAAPFWVNAATYLGVIAALMWWRPPAGSQRRLPAEHFISAIRIGLRHARYNGHLRATLVRAAGFFVAASAYWALLPLVARDQVNGGARLYGLLLGAIGAAAVAGALILPRAKAVLGADRLATVGAVGTAVALALFGLARDPAVAFIAAIFAGLSWIAVLATLNVSAQVSLPAWVRGRGLAMFTMLMFGAMALGSAIWGQVAGLAGLPVAHFAAAAALVITVPLLGRWKLQTGAGQDLTPSMHWPTPLLADEVESDRGPVLVTVEYRIRLEDRAAFLAAISTAEHQRRRDGAYAWRVYEDIAAAGVFVETFQVDSWLEHLRQHERVTNADRISETELRRFHVDGQPKITHLIATEPHPRM